LVHKKGLDTRHIHLNLTRKKWCFGSHLLGDDLAQFMEIKDRRIAVDANQFGSRSRSNTCRKLLK